MHWVYLLEHNQDASWYIGYTTNLKRRLHEHTSGYGSRTTALKHGDYTLIYCEGYSDKQDALQRETFLKSGSGRTFLRKQLTHYLNN